VSRRRSTAAAAVAVALLAIAAPDAHAQEPAPAPAPAPAPVPPPALGITAPALRAAGIAIPVAGRGAAPGATVALQRLVGGVNWVTIKSATAAADGTVRLRYTPTNPSPTLRYRLRLASGGVASPPVTVRTRNITLAAFGDANFGDGVATVMDSRGALYPWSGVAPTLRRADIAFGNLECAISNRGFAVPKQFNFRGRPERLAQVIRFAGLDVLNLANNHAGDYGQGALLDTVRNVRAGGALAVGAGASLAAAQRPQVISRLGLRVGFVGFSDINPAGFVAGPASPGTSFASPAAIAAGVRAARRVSDVVVATFHWGVERSPNENERQRAFARAAFAAGATAVIAAHPHVLQPIRRLGAGRRRLVAYSLGNFVWSASSAASSRTGILRVQLSGRGVEGARLLPARIEGTRPRLLG
jgi:poly-gamma-glutamate capsule biosynthesis protein CapA/YwtB (metallophosphatase superfamily)